MLHHGLVIHLGRVESLHPQLGSDGRGSAFLDPLAAQIRAAINPLKYILVRRYASKSGNSWYYTRVRPGYVGD